MRRVRFHRAAFCPYSSAAGGGCQRFRGRYRYRHQASRPTEPPSAAPQPTAAARSRGVSISSVTNEDENTKQQCKQTEVFRCENQDGISQMSSPGNRHIFTQRSRNCSPVKLEINLQESDDECELVIDVPKQAVKKKPRKRNNRTNKNRDEELAAVICAEKIHDSAIADVLRCTEEKSEKIITWQKNSKGLNKSEKLGNVSSKANEIDLPDVNSDTLKFLEERDALVYTEETHLSSAASEADVRKGILKQGSAESKILVEAFNRKHTTNEDYVSRGRGTQSVFCSGHSSKDETTIERPYKERINTVKRQSIEENRGNDIPEDTYPCPTYYLNERESEVTLQDSSVEEAEPHEEDTELSESDDPLEECRRIFDEFERKAQKKDGDKQDCEGNADLGLLETKANVSGKKRIAHTAKIDVHSKKVPLKASPWQQNHNAEIRQAPWETMKSAAAVKSGQAFVTITSEQTITMPELSSTPFQRIGPVASLNLLGVQPIETRNGMLYLLAEGSVATAMPCGLSVGSLKGFTLVPHKVSTQKRPSIPASGSKVPLETRQRYVDFFFAECTKICSTVDEAIDKAMREEQSVYDRSGSKKMYLNFAVKALKKLRDQGQLSNSRSSCGTGSINSEEEKAFTGGALYELLKSYLLTEEQLKENNFPRPNPEKSGSAILTGVARNAGYDALKRVCCRCGEIYAVTTSGEHRRKEECNYHSGKVLEQKVPGGMEKRYSCCERIVGSTGCQIARLHVHDGSREKLEGFMKTLIKSPPFDGNYGVYALDCEKCYTTHGLELTRVTVVDAKLQVVYDAFVKPDGNVVDYDIRLSGATEDDLNNTKTSLRDVQAILLNLFSANTILIGHCLENDLLVLKLIHDTVVDTSVVFPHRLGLPHKRALRNLMADYLRRIRQDDVEGHNSREDATACMELILWKVKEDNKRRKR